MKKYLDGYLSVYAYCLIPDHYHFFARVKEVEHDEINELLEQQFKKFLSSYSLAYNKENNRRGSLFQKRFKRVKVDDPGYFTSIIRYIHNNPIHHHFASNYKDWKYTSFNAIVGSQPTDICRKEVLEWFGGREAFLDFHKLNIVFDKNSFF